MGRKHIHFVDRDRLDEELDALGIDTPTACGVCGDEIGTDEIGTLVRTVTGFEAVCHKPMCLDTYDRRLEMPPAHSTDEAHWLVQVGLTLVFLALVLGLIFWTVAIVWMVVV